MIVEIGLCGAAGFLFLRGIYHSGVLTGWIAQGLSQPAPPPTPTAATLDPAIDDARWRDMFLANPTAFWLDPNLWGDNPNWRDDLPVWTQWGQPIDDKGRWIVKPVMPDCPVCQANAAVIVLTEHGGEATMWHCGHCMAEFTRKGETRKSRKARLVIEAKAQRMADAAAAEIAERVLPCGCSGDVTTRSYPSGGWDMGRYAVCKTCDGCWDYAPKYDDTGNPRKRVRGEVEWPNGDKREIDVPLDMPTPPAVD